MQPRVSWRLPAVVATCLLLAHQTSVEAGSITCGGDTNGDTVVNVTDLVNVILCWTDATGGNGIDCPEVGDNTDLNGDGVVDVRDLATSPQSVVMNWGAVCTLANDDCDQAIDLPGDGTYGWNNVGSTLDGIPFGCGFAVNDVWFNYTAPADGEVTIDTCGSDATDPDLFDTVLEVYDGTSCPVQAEDRLGCNDDCTSDCAGSVDACLAIPVTSGQALKIRIGGWQGTSEGTGQLTVEFTPPGSTP